MTKNRTLIAAGAAGLVLFAGLAWGAPVLQRLKVLFNGGIAIGTASQTATSANTITNSLAGSGSFDSPAIGAGAANCADSPPITVTGAALGDPCIAADTTGAPHIEVQDSCFVSASNTVKVRRCAARADAGTLDLGDAGFRVRTFSNQ